MEIIKKELDKDVPPAVGKIFIKKEEELMETSDVPTGNQLYIKTPTKRKVRVRKKIIGFPYQCQSCDAKYQTKMAYDYHLLTHTGARPHVCNFCGKAYRGSALLRLHIMDHTGERPHKCQVCGKGYKEGRQLRKHMMNHTGERPFKCIQCTATFKCKISLESHMVIHDSTRSHECMVCNKKFRQIQSLSRHLNLHRDRRPHACEICGQGFAERKQLKLHIMDHTGERPFKCHLCNAGFKIENTLRKHIATHNGDHECSICSVKFCTANRLTQHKKTHKNNWETIRRQPVQRVDESLIGCTICNIPFKTKESKERHELLHASLENKATTAMTNELIEIIRKSTKKQSPKDVTVTDKPKVKDACTDIDDKLGQDIGIAIDKPMKKDVGIGPDVTDGRAIRVSDKMMKQLEKTYVDKEVQLDGGLDIEEPDERDIGINVDGLADIQSQQKDKGDNFTSVGATENENLNVNGKTSESSVEGEGDQKETSQNQTRTNSGTSAVPNGGLNNVCIGQSEPVESTFSPSTLIVNGIPSNRIGTIIFGHKVAQTTGGTLIIGSGVAPNTGPVLVGTGILPHSAIIGNGVILGQVPNSIVAGNGILTNSLAAGNGVLANPIVTGGGVLANPVIGGNGVMPDSIVTNNGELPHTLILGNGVLKNSVATGNGVLTNSAPIGNGVLPSSTASGSGILTASGASMNGTITSSVANMSGTVTNSVGNMNGTVTVTGGNMNGPVTNSVANMNSTVTDSVNNVKGTVTNSVTTGKVILPHSAASGSGVLTASVSSMNGTNSVANVTGTVPNSVASVNGAKINSVATGKVILPNSAASGSGILATSVASMNGTLTNSGASGKMILPDPVTSARIIYPDPIGSGRIFLPSSWAQENAVQASPATGTKLMSCNINCDTCGSGIINSVAIVKRYYPQPLTAEDGAQTATATAASENEVTTKSSVTEKGVSTKTVASRKSQAKSSVRKAGVLTSSVATQTGVSTESVAAGVSKDLVAAGVLADSVAAAGLTDSVAAESKVLSKLVAPGNKLKSTARMVLKPKTTKKTILPKNIDTGVGSLPSTIGIGKGTHMKPGAVESLKTKNLSHKRGSSISLLADKQKDIQKNVSNEEGSSSHGNVKEGAISKKKTTSIESQKLMHPVLPDTCVKEGKAQLTGNGKGSSGKMKLTGGKQVAAIKGTMHNKHSSHDVEVMEVINVMGRKLDQARTVDKPSNAVADGKAMPSALDTNTKSNILSQGNQTKTDPKAGKSKNSHCARILKLGNTYVKNLGKTVRENETSKASNKEKGTYLSTMGKTQNGAGVAGDSKLKITEVGSGKLKASVVVGKIVESMVPAKRTSDSDSVKRNLDAEVLGKGTQITSASGKVVVDKETAVKCVSDTVAPQKRITSALCSGKLGTKVMSTKVPEGKAGSDTPVMSEIVHTKSPNWGKKVNVEVSCGPNDAVNGRLIIDDSLDECQYTSGTGASQQHPSAKQQPQKEIIDIDESKTNEDKSLSCEKMKVGDDSALKPNDVEENLLMQTGKSIALTSASSSGGNHGHLTKGTSSANINTSNVVTVVANTKGNGTLVSEVFENVPDAVASLKGGAGSNPANLIGLVPSEHGFPIILLDSTQFTREALRNIPSTIMKTGSSLDNQEQCEEKKASPDKKTIFRVDELINVERSADDCSPAGASLKSPRTTEKEDKVVKIGSGNSVVIEQQKKVTSSVKTGNLKGSIATEVKGIKSLDTKSVSPRKAGTSQESPHRIGIPAKTIESSEGNGTVAKSIRQIIEVNTSKDSYVMKKVDKDSSNGKTSHVVKKADKSSLIVEDSCLVKKVAKSSLNGKDSHLVKKVDKSSSNGKNSHVVKKVNKSSLTGKDSCVVKKVDKSSSNGKDSYVVKKVDKSSSNGKASYVMKKVGKSSSHGKASFVMKKEDKSSWNGKDSYLIKKMDRGSSNGKDLYVLKKMNKSSPNAKSRKGKFTRRIMELKGILEITSDNSSELTSVVIRTPVGKKQGSDKTSEKEWRTGLGEDPDSPPVCMVIPSGSERLDTGRGGGEGDSSTTVDTSRCTLAKGCKMQTAENYENGGKILFARLCKDKQEDSSQNTAAYSINVGNLNANPGNVIKENSCEVDSEKLVTDSENCSITMEPCVISQGRSTSPGGGLDVSHSTEAEEINRGSTNSSRKRKMDSPRLLSEGMANVFKVRVTSGGSSGKIVLDEEDKELETLHGNEKGNVLKKTEGKKPCQKKDSFSHNVRRQSCEELAKFGGSVSQEGGVEIIHSHNGNGEKVEKPKGDRSYSQKTDENECIFDSNIKIKEEESTETEVSDKETSCKKGGEQSKSGDIFMTEVKQEIDSETISLTGESLKTGRDLPETKGTPVDDEIRVKEEELEDWELIYC